MRKNISFSLLLGVGIGLVLSSGIGIMFFPQGERIDPEFIKSEAKKLGMIEASDYINKEKIQAGDPETKIKDTIIIEIPENTSDEKVAKLLKEKGLIKSEKEFIKKVREGKSSNKIQEGKFEFKKDDILDDIKEKIITDH